MTIQMNHQNQNQSENNNNSNLNEPRMITGQYSQHTGQYSQYTERVQSTRKISSTIVEEEYLGTAQEYPVQEVEVPGPIQEVIKTVTRKEIIEQEKRVPKYEVEYIDKIVEVPRIEYVDKVVEVPRIQEVIREVRVPQIVDVPREVIREVKVPRVNYVEKTVEVTGPTVEVEKVVEVVQNVEVLRYHDTPKPLIVAQTVRPVIAEGAGYHEVDVYEYEPECVPVDVHVVKPVTAPMSAGEMTASKHRVVSVPPAQYNSLLQQLNSHLSEQERSRLPYVVEQGHNEIQFHSGPIAVSAPQPGVHIAGLQSHETKVAIDYSTKRVIPIDWSQYPQLKHHNNNVIHHQSQSSGHVIHHTGHQGQGHVIHQSGQGHVIHQSGQGHVIHQGQGHVIHQGQGHVVHSGSHHVTGGMTTTSHKVTTTSHQTGTHQINRPNGSTTSFQPQVTSMQMSGASMQSSPLVPKGQSYNA